MGSSEKFTPGPWQVCDHDNWHYGIRGDFAATKRQETICKVCKGCLQEASREFLADAHLIAAAPELYDMLKELHSYFHHDPGIWSRIYDLLAKARGEEVQDGD